MGFPGHLVLLGTQLWDSSGTGFKYSKLQHSQLSTDQKQHRLILRDYHRLHSSSHHLRNYILPVNHISCYPTPSTYTILQFNPPPNQHILLVIFFRKIIISQLSSEQTVYPLILRHYHSLHSSPHYQRNYIYQ